MKKVSTAGVWLLLLAVAPLAAGAQESEPANKFIPAAKEQAVEPTSYIVVLADGVRPEDVTRDLRGTVLATYSKALNGFAAEFDEEELARLLDDSRVTLIEQNTLYWHQANVQQAAVPTWGLDRVDQRFLPLSTDYWRYSSGSDASNVHAYVLDTGIRPDHVEFGGRVLTGPGQAFDAILDGCPHNGCSGGPFAFCTNFSIGGHGTHVAGTIGATSFGVAKQVNLHSVRVLACGGSGPLSGVILGVDWVALNHVKPAVANMSLQGPFSVALNNAVTNLINLGVPTAVAAGNSPLINPCNQSPSAVPTALTVAATAITDARASFSSFGTCVDLFAPGQAIPSTWNSSTTATATLSGTSMATPHVAGTAALFFSEYPLATSAEVNAGVVGNATPGVVTNPGTGTPNLLLYSRLRARFNTETGSLAGTGAEGIHPLGVNRFYTQRYDGPLEARLVGTGTNFDLRLFRRDPVFGWLLVASSTSAGSTERVLFQGTAGDYYWSVLSVNGAGTYTLTWSQP
jgi:subtilisin family serine protease